MQVSFSHPARLVGGGEREIEGRIGDLNRADSFIQGQSLSSNQYYTNDIV